MPKRRNVSKEDSNPGSLDCESGILPLSYRAPRNCRDFFLAEFNLLTCGSQWLGVRMADSQSRKPGFESSANVSMFGHFRSVH